MADDSNKKNPDLHNNVTVPVSDITGENKTQKQDITEAIFPHEAKTISDSEKQTFIEKKIRQIEEEEEQEIKLTKKVDPLIGRIIAERFEILSKIGSGGMGAVYKAKQIGMDRNVAIKVLLQEYTADERILKRFQIEALAVSRLTHPNTIRIYDFGKEEGIGFYIAMEFLDGKSLHSVMKDDGQISVARSLKIVRQVCNSLKEAHEKNIIHRDLKPDNIFLLHVGDEPDFVKVLDFGVAKLKEADKSQGTLTQAGMIFGTPKYMSPEQCRSSNTDARSDIYSIGVILYEMLLGRAPFEGDTPLSILLQHIQELPKEFAVTRSDIEVPLPVEELVFKALQKNPDDRYQTISELAKEIETLENTFKSSYTTVVFAKAGMRHRMRLDRSESKTVMDTRLERKIELLSKKAKKKKILIYSTAGTWLVLLITVLMFFYFILPSAPREYKTLILNNIAFGSIKPVTVETVKINFTSNPEGAVVLVEGKEIGKTPFVYERKKQDAIVAYQMQIIGYVEKQGNVKLLSDNNISEILEKIPDPKGSIEKKTSVKITKHENKISESAKKEEPPPTKTELNVPHPAKVKDTKKNPYEK